MTTQTVLFAVCDVCVYACCDVWQHRRCCLLFAMNAIVCDVWRYFYVMSSCCFLCVMNGVPSIFM